MRTYFSTLTIYLGLSHL